MAGLSSWVSSQIAALDRPARFAAAPRINCFHCSLPMPGEARLWVEFDGEQKPVCCVGCQSLFNLVISNGMIHYYRERERRAAGH